MKIEAEEKYSFGTRQSPVSALNKLVISQINFIEDRKRRDCFEKLFKE